MNNYLVFKLDFNFFALIMFKSLINVNTCTFVCVMFSLNIFYLPNSEQNGLDISNLNYLDFSIESFTYNNLDRHALYKHQQISIVRNLN